MGEGRNVYKIEPGQDENMLDFFHVYFSPTIIILKIGTQENYY